MYLFAIFVLTIATLIAYVKWSQTYWARKKVPHLEPSFFFGNFKNPIVSKMRSIPMYFLEFYNELKEKGFRCGGIYAYFAPVFVIADPAYNRQLLVKDFHNFHIRGFYSNKKRQPVSLNIFTSEGEDWRKLRMNVNPTFTTAKMKVMFDLMKDVAKSMEDYLDEHAARKLPINAKECAGYYTTDIVATCSFGMDTNSFETNTFSDALKKLMHDSFSFTRISFCSAFPKRANFLGIPLFEAQSTDNVCNLLENTVRDRVRSNITRNDFLQTVLDLKRENKINDTEVNSHCLLFVLAGFETMGIAFTFALFELAVNKDVQDKLRIEVNEILDKYGTEATYEAVSSMKYLEMFISEVLRKYPPVPILNRTSVADVKLPNTDFIIEQGTKIVIPVMGFHHDPEYFPDPDKFDPDRFSIANKPNIKPYAYIPFGDGPRGCIGERFAKQALKVGISAIVRRYRVKLNPKVKLPLHFDSSLTILPTTEILLDIREVEE